MNRICRKNQKLFSAYVDGMLSEGLKKSVDGHLNSCSECQAAFKELESLRALLREFPVRDPGPGFETAILNRVRERPEILSLRGWSRRVSYGLAGLALLLMVTLYLQRTALPPRLEVTRIPAPKLQPVGKNKKVPEQNSVSSGADVRLDKYAGKPAAPQDTVRERQRPTNAPPVNGGELKSEAKPALRDESSPYNLEYKSVPKEESDKAVVLREGSEFLAAQKSLLLVIRNKSDWEKTWNVQNTAQNLSLPLPEVNFKNQMVVLLPTNQSGQEYKIVKTVEKPDRIIVQYRVTRPAPNEGEIVPPYQLEVVNTRTSVELQKLE